jgi:anti-sigma regulatory factor (Ser/Thr protein kinase)
MFYEVKNYDTLQAALRSLCDFLQSENVPQNSVFDCKLVACELLGNVICHAKGTARIVSEIKNGFVEMKIISDSVFFPKEKTACAEVTAEHGRGLFLVETVTNGDISIEQDGLKIRIRIEA